MFLSSNASGVALLGLASMCMASAQNLRGSTRAPSECPVAPHEVQQCSCLEVLQVNGFLEKGQDIDSQDIKNGYRRGAKFYHPDKGTNSSKAFVFLGACKDLFELTPSEAKEYVAAVEKRISKSKEKGWDRKRLGESYEDVNDDFHLFDQVDRRQDDASSQSRKDGLYLPDDGVASDALHLFLDNSLSMADEGRLDIAHVTLQRLLGRLEQTPTNVHFIGTHSWIPGRSHLEFSQTDTYDLEDVLGRWRANGTGTYLWHYVLKQFQEVALNDDLEACIITDGCDNWSPNPFRGTEGFNAMMKELKKVGAKVRIHVLYVGEDLVACPQAAPAYRAVAIASGGIFTNIKSLSLDDGDRKRIGEFVGHVSSSHYNRVAKAIDFRQEYERLYANGLAMFLPWYSPLSLSEKALVALKIKGMEKSAGRGRFRSTSSRRSGPGTGSCQACCGFRILEADRIVKPKRASLTEMIRNQCPDLRNYVEQPPGRRSYARVKVPLDQEERVRFCIKEIASNMGARSNVKLVDQCFDSPRD